VPTAERRLEDGFLRRGAVRHLVRDLLGCECPEEVFEDVLVAFPAHLERPLPGSVKLVVGGRLVIVLVPADTLVDLERDARVLLERGRAMRDQCGLNRFRLVLVGRVPASARVRLQRAAARLDDRTHVHAIAPARLT
jgi:hypothetical protein